jgi:multiple sugar transport system substrate-binding protein
MKRRYSTFLGIAWLAALLLLGACAPGELLTPREMTATAVAAADRPAATPPPLQLPAPTPTAGAPPAGTPSSFEPGTINPSIVVWVNETSAAHAVALERMAADFTGRSGIQVEMVQVSPRLLPDLVQTAVLSGTLPDLVLHPMEFTMGWTDSGILNPTAAEAALAALGPQTFAPAALAAVTTAEGQVAALPSDGWAQLLIYRQDWFAERGLPPPTSYNTIISATAAIADPEIGRSGLVLATESSLVSTQQVFEYLATANGCDLIDARGEVQLLHPACLDALDYYRELINGYSPSDVQTDVSALNAYLAGRTGLIIVPSSVLPQLAGLDPLYPVRCPDCSADDFLVRNSGIVTTISGRSDFSEPTSFSELSYLGITSAADQDAAAAFAGYWFSDGYLTWLGVNPERKIPLRRGTVSTPDSFAVAWRELPLTPGGPSGADLFGTAVVAEIQAEVENPERWAFRVGQGRLMTDIYEGLTLSLVLQELLSGYFTSSYAIIEAYNRVTDLIPGYAFYPQEEPTATPES